MTGTMTLRDELLGASTALPGYSLVLPSGWHEFPADATAERHLTGLATARLREQHRPDLDAQLRALTGRAFAGLRASSAVAVYLQTEAWADELVLPLSITASVRTAPGGGSLDDIVSELIRTRGASALHGDRRFVRWESDSKVAVGAATVGQHTVAYLTPFPEPGRRRALQFTAVATHPIDDPDESWRPVVERMSELADAVVSTFEWHRR
ncbi:hypothetical protein EDM22_17535 [Agromyces tardus]|jgi:hypothetical protein|uniref:Uncharacterized protein n=2 Tax=Agromyces tardus TaxID=2583849 RepID=A0A3M8A0Z0_9MICO|nr:hypothetical protein [Agromyces tardus]RNB44601.1 hypothetical protein EDM22_17535 [Agromyces tardus]